MANQSQSATRTIEEIRKTCIDQDTLQKIQQDKAEMDRVEKENAQRLHKLERR